MAAISASQVKELRERTGLGMMECKKALAAADGVVAVKVADDASYAVLVEVNSETDFVTKDEGFKAFVTAVVEKAFADKQSSIETLAADMEDARQALVQKCGENVNVRRVQLTEAPVVGAYVHSNSRIGVLVALEGGTTELAKDVAMHVAAVNPQVATPDEMPADVVAKEKEIYVSQAIESGKPPEIAEKMVVGRLKKFLAESSLVEQPFVRDPDIKVGKMLADAGTSIKGFTRYEVGEGIEVEEVDFAAEVAAQVNATK